MTYLSRPGVTRARVEVLSVGRGGWSWVRSLEPFSVHGDDYPSDRAFLWSADGLEDDGQLELPAVEVKP